MGKFCVQMWTGSWAPQMCPFLLARILCAVVPLTQRAISKEVNSTSLRKLRTLDTMISEASGPGAIHLSQLTIIFISPGNEQTPSSIRAVAAFRSVLSLPSSVLDQRGKES